MCEFNRSISKLTGKTITLIHHSTSNVIQIIDTSDQNDSTNDIYLDTEQLDELLELISGMKNECI